MESIVVIKVRYGETLRRFNGRVVNERLDLDIDGLRRKIFGLFSLTPDDELMLTYIDEDGDVVTLVDDEDLDDAMRQSLNPLRIAVNLNADKSGRHCARSSGYSTLMRSPQIQQKTPSLDANVYEIMKSVPDPFHEAFSKFSADLATKASSSSPVIAELVDCVSKMGLSYLNPVSESQAGVESSQQGGVSGGILDTSVTEELGASKIDGNNPDVQQKAASGSQTLLRNQVLPDPFSPKLKWKNKMSDLKNPEKSVDASAMPLSAIEATFRPSTVSSSSAVEVPVGPSPLSKKVSVCQGEENSQYGFLSANFGDLGSGIGMKSSCSGTLSEPQFGTSSIGECPSTVMPVVNDLPMPPPQCIPRLGPFERSCNKNEGIGTIFHKGVRCDGCGVHPITGPRFKSKVKEDYDLCHICFEQMGNDTDYIRMNRPAIYRQPFALQGLYDPPRVHHRKLPQVMKRMKHRPKPDSRFVQDVNVLDGTIMAPSTQFTKIWRMRNNGTTLWPRGTQLVWIGGDRLSNAQSVELEVPSNGLPVDEELDIAVDFTSPELPGRYISYWRMALPFGQKFGQRVWVLIQVDASLRDFVSGSFKGLNLNLPPPTNEIVGPEIINVNVEPVVVEDSSSQPDNSNRATNLVGSGVEAPPRKEQEPNYPTNDPLIVGSPTQGYTSASVSYPIIDFSESSQPAVPSSLPPPKNEQSFTQHAAGNSEVEQILLRELEDMGFKQVDLNKEILRMNKYDLEQSVDDLCGVANWETGFVDLQEDWMLKELEKMGFFDKETNRKLLRKNYWSLKRVVMDLISGKKA